MDDKQKFNKIVLENVKNAMNDEGFSWHDMKYFGEIAMVFEELVRMGGLPSVVKWHINEWEYFGNIIFDTMELLGYDLIGNESMGDERYGLLSSDVDDKLYDYYFAIRDDSDYTYIDSKSLHIVGTEIK